MKDLKFPIGQFIKPDFITDNYFQQRLKVLEEFPQNLINETIGLGENTLKNLIYYQTLKRSFFSS